MAASRELFIPGPYADEYTDRYTPEVARSEGYEAGVRSTLENTIARIKRFKSPTKQMQELLAELQDQLDVLDK